MSGSADSRSRYLTPRSAGVGRATQSGAEDCQLEVCATRRPQAITETLPECTKIYLKDHLGYPDQAFQKSAAACTLAQERSHPYNLAAAQIFAARFHQLRRDRALTHE